MEDVGEGKEREGDERKRRRKEMGMKERREGKREGKEW